MISLFFFFQAEDGIRDADVTGVQTCALPISIATPRPKRPDTSASAQSEVNIGTAGSVAAHRKRDRKSTRLNSSHVRISYAVFCLKKNNTPSLSGKGQNVARCPSCRIALWSNY